VWFVVSGSDKADVVGQALSTTPPDVHDIPAVGVRGALETIWFLDRDSASRL
jgi:6-phosphogluconolactonase